MNSHTPTQRDISPTDGLDLDERDAVAHFLGKSVAEAEALFRENVSFYSNDLHWMGGTAFRFYVPAFCNYLKSDASKESFDGLYSFVVLFEARMPHDMASLVSVKDELLSCLDYCIANYAKFAVNAEVYGDLKSKLVELRARLERAK